MVFASFAFLFWFLPAFLLVYHAAPPRWRNLALTLGSFVFYGWWRPHYVLLMLGSVAVDYLAARAMGGVDSGRRRRRWLWLSIATNLGLLGWFKYTNLLVDTWNDLTPWPVAWERVLLPVGISFFTFQSMSYTIDVYRGDVRPVRSFGDLLCFVSMFPQLVAGPVVRYRDVQDQIAHRTVDLVGRSDGVLLFALGLAKKVLIADSVAPLVDAVWALEQPGFAAAWLGGVAFSVQIYFDFSGYSDMAIGLGRVLGFRFPSNFLSPYRAPSLTELWRRWHVSLSTWLRDYLYVPLGGNRRGEGRAQVNVMATMLLGGLWHGAAWNFLLWGGLHGLLLVLERRLGKASPYARLPRPAQVAVTFLLWTATMMVFRSDSAGDLARIGAAAAGLGGADGVPALGGKAPFAYAALGLGLAIAFALPRSEQLVQRCQPLVMLGALLLGLVAIGHLLGGEYTPFLYFQF
ncbi:MAG: MBOAT family protein [Planctomycetes bacterium]|nr:MBOAT family protein [Planctomycetota bacterium]